MGPIQLDALAVNMGLILPKFSNLEVTKSNLDI